MHIIAHMSASAAPACQWGPMKSIAKMDRVNLSPRKLAAWGCQLVIVIEGAITVIYFSKKHHLGVLESCEVLQRQNIWSS